MNSFFIYGKFAHYSIIETFHGRLLASGFRVLVIQGVIFIDTRDNLQIRRKLLFTIVITTLAVFIGFKFLLPLFLPFVIAYFLAWIVRPLTEFLNRRLKLPRIIGGTVSLILLISIIGVAMFYLVNKLLKQAILFFKNIPIYLNIIAGKLDAICQSCDELFGLVSGTARAFMDDNMKVIIDRVKTNIMPGLTEHTISFAVKFVSMVGIILIIFVSAALIVKDYHNMRDCMKKSKFYQDFHKITERLADTGIVYLRTQLIIMLIVAFLCVLGLTIIKNEYALLAGLGIAIMDALPILGSGIIFIPWCIIMLLNGNFYAAAVLVTTYLLCQIVREVLEPKLIGDCIGTKPLFTLIAMYVGVQLFSIAGFVLGPIGLVIIITTVTVIREKLEENSRDKEDLPLGDDGIST